MRALHTFVAAFLSEGDFSEARLSPKHGKTFFSRFLMLILILDMYRYSLGARITIWTLMMALPGQVTHIDVSSLNPVSLTAE